MSTTRTRAEKIAAGKARIAKWQKSMKKLENQEKKAENRVRVKRFCTRAGFIESVLPDTVILDKERFEKFVKRCMVSAFGKERLNELLAEQKKVNSEVTEPETAPEEVKTAETKKPKPTETPASTDSADDEDDMFDIESYDEGIYDETIEEGA